VFGAWLRQFRFDLKVPTVSSQLCLQPACHQKCALSFNIYTSLFSIAVAAPALRSLNRAVLNSLALLSGAVVLRLQANKQLTSTMAQPRIFTFSKGGGSKGDKTMKELVSAFLLLLCRCLTVSQADCTSNPCHSTWYTASGYSVLCLYDLYNASAIAEGS
jgi:hypothetical protein